MVKKNRSIIILLCVLLVIIIVGTAVILLIPDGNSSEYSEKISVAKEYYNKQNYEYSIKYFRQAIKIQPENEESYRLLGLVYIKTGDNDKALDVWKEGYDKTKSEKIKELIEKYSDESNSSSSDNGNAESKSKDNNANTPSFDMDCLGNISRFNYASYVNKYGKATVNSTDDSATVSFRNLEGTFTFNNSDEMIKVNEGEVQNTAMPDSISLDDISVLFKNYKDGITSADLQNSFISSVKQERNNEENKNVITFKYQGCVFQIECDAEGKIKDKNAWNIIVPVDMSEESDENKKTYSVNLKYNTDLTKPVENCRIVISDENNETVYDDTVNENFDVDLSEGKYKVRVFADTESEQTKDWNITDKTTDTDLKLLIIDPERMGEINIVLTWGERPRDIDSHLIGEGEHIWYANKNENDCRLDVDITTSYGPETVTISNTKGEYTYYVKNFSGEAPLSESDAEITVSMPGQDPKTFTIPSGIEDVWEVFRIKNGKIEEINREASENFDNVNNK